MSSEKWLQTLPEVPTFGELGLAGMQFNTWFGLASPAAIPTPVVDKLNAAINAALKSPDLSKRLTDMRAEAQTGSAEQFGEFWAKELQR